MKVRYSAVVLGLAGCLTAFATVSPVHKSANVIVKTHTLIPHTFYAGEVASASEVNANFQALSNYTQVLGMPSNSKRAVSSTAQLFSAIADCHSVAAQQKPCLITVAPKTYQLTQPLQLTPNIDLLVRGATTNGLGGATLLAPQGDTQKPIIILQGNNRLSGVSVSDADQVGSVIEVSGNNNVVENANIVILGQYNHVISTQDSSGLILRNSKISTRASAQNALVNLGNNTVVNFRGLNITSASATLAQGSGHLNVMNTNLVGSQLAKSQANVSFVNSASQATLSSTMKAIK